MKQIKFFLGAILFLQSYAQANINVCEDLFLIRESQFAQSAACFEKHLEGNISELEKSISLNRLSYLNFYFGIHIAPNEKLQAMEKAQTLSKLAAEVQAPWLDEAQYQKLSSEQKRQLSYSLYYYGTALAAKAEIQGDLAVVIAWPEIQKVMKLILRLGNADVEGYGAYRTLAIANTRIPAIAGGDKKLAEQYFKLILKNTKAYPSNTLGYADLLLRLDRKQEACSLLQSLISLTTEEQAKLQPGVREVSKDIIEATRQFGGNCK